MRAADVPRADLMKTGDDDGDGLEAYTIRHASPPSLGRNLE